MKVDDELKELKASEARAIQAVHKIAAEIRPVLAEDLLRYPAREVRRRFVADPEFAGRLPDAAIAGMKDAVAARAARARDEIMARMEEEAAWLAGVDAGGPGKSLAENEALWAPTRLAAEVVAAALKEYGFPDDGEAPDYRMPTWFIGGKYLPGLAEKYWALMAEVREVRSRTGELEQKRVRDALAKRWDES